MSIVLKKRNIEWARRWLEPGMRSIFSYILKRNSEFNVSTFVVEAEEEYAVWRQSFSKKQIEQIIKREIVIVR